MADKPHPTTIPTSLEIQGRNHKVPLWRYENVLLVIVADALYKDYSQVFLDRLLDAKATTGNPYASHNASELRLPARIGKTCVYLEIDLNPRQTRRRTEQIMELMGLSPSDLEYLYD